MAAAAILDFQKFEFFTGPIFVTTPNFIKISRTVAEMWIFNDFFS